MRLSEKSENLCGSAGLKSPARICDRASWSSGSRARYRLVSYLDGNMVSGEVCLFTNMVEVEMETFWGVNENIFNNKIKSKTYSKTR